MIFLNTWLRCMATLASGLFINDTTGLTGEFFLLDHVVLSGLGSHL